MKILYTSDIHVNDRHLDTLCALAAEQAVDTLIIGGDLIPHYLPRLAAKDLLEAQTAYLETVLVPKICALKQKKDMPVYLDLGNDDLFGARKVLTALDGDLIHLLHLRRHPLTESVDIVGYMIVPPTPFQRKDWEKPDSRENPFEQGNRILLNGYVSRRGSIEPTVLDLDSADTIESDLNRLSGLIERPFIFVAHSPPYGTPLDVLSNGTYVGSRSIRRFIQKWSEKGHLIASLHGHIHESPFRSGSIQTRIGKALCLNPGQATDFRYVIFELDVRQPLPQVRIL
jgi:Icc-related predicted phosphoesterase